MNFDQFNKDLRSHGAYVFFSKLAERDFKSFSAGKRNEVMVLIYKQAKKGRILNRKETVIG